MTDLMKLVSTYAKPLYNLAKVVGPFVLSQSSKAISNYESFRLNKERFEALSVFIRAEAENLAKERSLIREQIISLSGLERVRAQQDYDLLTKEINRLTTIDGIKYFIKEDSQECDSTAEISDGWAEKFNQLASSLNEEWRKKLLAKAFAIELEKPGTINIVVLNSIGAFDENTFRTYGALLNLSTRLYNISCLPHNIERDTITVNGMDITISQALYRLSHLNLFDARHGGYISIRNETVAHLRYGKRVLHLKRKAPVGESQLEALLTTDLGNKLSLLYERECSVQGEGYFNMFIDSARVLNIIEREVTLSDFDHGILGN